MQFPDTPRVIYQRNTLVEVICQLRFDRILRIDAEVPAGFQEAIRRDYPTLVEGVAGPNLGEMNASLRKGYDFGSADGSWTVSLTSEFIALSATKYVRWEEFRQRLVDVGNVFVSQYAVTNFRRVGLRYRNVIQRGRLGLEGQAWGKLLKAELAGELTMPGVEEHAESVTRQLLLRSDHDQSQLHLLHGFVRAQPTNELCYLIDADFFREQPMERNDVQTYLEDYNRRAGKLFRWCISDALHRAMAPDPIAPSIAS